jgi:hypothetical protein
MKKRFFLITTGTIGGLGAVLAVTPPQFGGAGGLAATDQGSVPVPSKSNSSAQSANPKPQQTPNKTSASPSNPPSANPTPAAPTTGVQTVTGDPFQADEGGRSWGTVRVKVTFTDGAITSINGTQSPTSRGQMAFDRLDPYVDTQKITVATIKSKSSNALPYVSGASYTCIAYWDSLKTAIQKAGL